MDNKHGKTETTEENLNQETNISYRIEIEILQKILSHSANFFSNRRILGSLTSKYCRQLVIMSTLLVLNNFIRKRTITKSRNKRSDFSN